MIPNYDAKFRYLVHRQKGLCPIAKAKKHWADPPTELHHRCHRIKWAVRRFPLFIDSVWNLMAVSHWAHMEWPSFGRITYLEAGKREAFLQHHPKIAEAINFETDTVNTR